MHPIILIVIGDGQVADWRRLEGIAVRRLDHVLGLRVDGTQQQLEDLRVLLGQRLVRPQLIRRVAQPFRNDVARDDERLGSLPCLIVPKRIEPAQAEEARVFGAARMELDSGVGR